MNKARSSRCLAIVLGGILITNFAVGWGQNPAFRPPASIADLQELVDSNVLVRIDLNTDPPEVVVGGAFQDASAKSQQETLALINRFLRGARQGTVTPNLLDARGRRVTPKAVEPAATVEP